MCQNIPLRGHRDSKNNHPKVGKVALLIQEIMQTYYSIESREETTILKSSFTMPHDMFFSGYIFLFCFCDISRQAVMLISYSFLCFTAWLVNINNSEAAVFKTLAPSKSCGNICFSVNTTNQVR